MYEQIDFFEEIGIEKKGHYYGSEIDWPFEPEVGAWVESHGIPLPHIMRQGYIGRKVVRQVECDGRELYKVGRLERYIMNSDGFWMSVIFDGSPTRAQVVHRPGVNIYECLDWHEYPERMKAIFGKENK